MKRHRYLPTELEGTLDGVTDEGGAETSEKSTGTLLGNDLSERANHTLLFCDINITPYKSHNSQKLLKKTNPVVNLGLELDSSLDDINGSEGTVGDGTTKSTSKSESTYLLSNLNEQHTAFGSK